ncbi:hypothetical protein MNV49_006857 [Pseudohyphozyma bogoriensis]|nr:hypothetical protein MNV49_006857 [Pseudohyphozyma bogoriensis]
MSPLRWCMVTMAFIAVFYGLRSSLSSEPELDAIRPLVSDVKEALKPGGEVIVPGIGRHSATIIFLHGLGGSSMVALPVIEIIRRELWQVTWRVPNSPVMAVSAEKGLVMPAWFDIDDLDLPPHSPMPAKEDEASMREAVARVHDLVAQEIEKGIDPDRIIIGGFSQALCGCAITLLAGLSTPEKLGGLMCLSGWLPLAAQLTKHGKGLKHPMQLPHAHNVPMFWGHGNNDSVIQYDWAEESISHLHKMGFKDIEFHTYPGLKHWIADDEVDHMSAWLQRFLPQT